jgi:hypothetical protein
MRMRNLASRLQQATLDTQPIIDSAAAKAAAATAAADAAAADAAAAATAVKAAEDAAAAAATAAADARAESNAAPANASLTDAAATTAAAATAAAAAVTAAQEASTQAAMKQGAAAMAAAAAKKRESDAVAAREEQLQKLRNEMAAIAPSNTGAATAGLGGGAGTGGASNAAGLGGGAGTGGASNAAGLGGAAPANAAGAAGGSNGAATRSPANTLVQSITNDGAKIIAKLNSLKAKSNGQKGQLDTFIQRLETLATKIQTTGSPLQEDELRNIQEAVNTMFQSLTAKINSLSSPDLEATITNLEKAVTTLNAAQNAAVAGGAGAAANIAAQRATNDMVTRSVNFALREIDVEATEKFAMGGMAERQADRIFNHFKTIARIPNFTEKNPIFDKANVRTAFAYLIDYMLKFNIFPTRTDGHVYTSEELSNLVNRSKVLTSASLKAGVTNKQIFDIIMSLPDILPRTKKGGNRMSRASRKSRNTRKQAKRNTRKRNLRKTRR